MCDGFFIGFCFGCVMWETERLVKWNNRAAFALGLLLGCIPLLANPGHEVTIAELTSQISLLPEAPELYFQRAWNYREIQKLAEARADWEKTLSIQPGFLPASRELARMDAAAGHPDLAMERLRKAMAAAPPEQAFHLAGCYSVLSELLLVAGKNEEALAEARAGLAASKELSLDLIMLRSEAQRRLGRHAERVDDLAAAKAKLLSFVVKARWYDALIDAGRGQEVLAVVENELANTRYQSSWLIRRARIRRHSGDAAGAQADLRLALEEIAPRLRPDAPDLSLVCDRGVIKALLGEMDSARQDLDLASQNGADFWLTLPLLNLLTESKLSSGAPSSGSAPPSKVLEKNTSSLPADPATPLKTGNASHPER